jgi:hypothetical protein
MKSKPGIFQEVRMYHHRIKELVFMLALVSTWNALPQNPAPLDLTAVRTAILERGARWQAADNALFRLSVKDKQAMLTPTTPSPSPADTLFEPDLDRSLPVSLDWRNHGGNFVTPVRNQGYCGSCWDFAAVAAAEARHAVRNHLTDPLMNLSEQQVLSCSGAGDCINGGYMNGALDYLRDTGAADENCFPYLELDLPCANRCASWADRAVKIQNWSWVTYTDYTSTDLIKAALLDGPVGTWFQVYEDFYGYASGVYSHVTGNYLGNHFVLIVGWDDALQAWLCKNSWDTDWGSLGGYFWAQFGGANCQFGSWTTAATGIPGGDLNHDGSVTTADLAIQQGYLAGVALPGGTRRADCDTVTDGAINAADLVWEIQKLNGHLP